MAKPPYTNPSTVGDAGTLTGGEKEDWASDTDTAQAVVSSVKRDFRLAQNYRKAYDSAWDRFRHYTLGDQWANKLRPAWKAKPTMNYINTTIETIIPIMTDHDPTINVAATKEQYTHLSEFMQAAVREVFAKNEMKVKQVLLLKDAHMYGVGWVKVWYNSKIKEIQVSPMDSRFVFFSPGALEPQQAEYIIVALNRWVSSCVRDFPKLAGRLGKGRGVTDESLTHRPVDTVKMYDQDTNFVLTSEGTMVGGDNGAKDAEDQQVTQIERWSRDKHGQVWVTVTVGDLLVKHEKSPYKNGAADWQGGSKFPFERCLCYPVNSQLVGMGEVANLESPQDAINRGEAQIADLVRMCTSPYMRVHKNSRVSLKDITNRIASYVIWDGTVAPDWMPPPGVSGELFTWVQSQMQHMDKLSGIYEASRGELPAAKTSGVAIENLQKATSGRIALKTRMFESFLRAVAIQVIDLVKQYYVNREIRIGKRYITVNKLLAANKVKNDISVADYDVEIGVGSTLPVDKAARADQAKEAFDAGVIGSREYLRKQGWDEEDIERALAERKEQEQEEMQMQAQMAQAEAPAPAAAPPQGAAPAPQPGAPAAAVPGILSEEELAAMEQEAAASEVAQ